MALITCPDCNKQISDSAESCMHCGKPMNTALKCPSCKSNDVEKISNASKVGSALMWGVLAAGKMSKTFKCKNCKTSW